MASANLKRDSHTIRTYDGVSLQTIEMNHNSLNDMDKKYQPYIINFIGNGMHCKQITQEMEMDALALKCNVVGFNYRGVGGSTGTPTSKDDLVTDGIAQVQRLLNQGVSPENITLKGHSLGAGVATLVARHFHNQGKQINLFNGRSFSSITNVVVGNIRTAGTGTGHSESFGRKIWGWLAAPFVKLGLSLTKWEINAGEAYASIPDSHKEYMLVRTPKADRDTKTLDDNVITHYGSLHMYLKNDRKIEKSNINKALVKAKSEEEKTKLESKRQHLKDRKMEARYKTNNGHVQLINNLSNSSNNSGATFFQAFTKNVNADHGVNKPSEPKG